MTRWEYKTVKFGVLSIWKGVDFDEDAVTTHINKLGANGWELVSAFDTNEGNGNSLHVVLIFKRPLSE